MEKGRGRGRESRAPNWPGLRKLWPKKLVVKGSCGQNGLWPPKRNPWELQHRVNRHDCSASHHLRFVPGLLFGQLRALPPKSGVKTTKRPLREFLPIQGASWLLCSTLVNSENEIDRFFIREREGNESHVTKSRLCTMRASCLTEQSDCVRSLSIRASHCVHHPGAGHQRRGACSCTRDGDHTRPSSPPGQEGWLRLCGWFLP